ncbi:hypothetical protein ABT364_03325 [Massilia sp. SR12]
MTRLLYITLLLFSCCCEAQESAPPKWKPGQVLAEKKEDLGFGFSLIHRSIVNPPSHWEGVGHFSFVYFEKRQLCQCGRSEFSISPSGRYALLQDGPSGKLLLFTTHLDKISEVTKQYVGSPQSFKWDEKNRSATVAFYQGSKNGYEDAAPISITLP